MTTAMSPAFVQELLGKDMEQRLLRDRIKELKCLVGDLQREKEDLYSALAAAKSQVKVWRTRAEQTVGIRGGK